MSTTKQKEVPVTVAVITELVQNYFRAHEFKALSPHISLRKGFIEVKWAEESASGQAAFSQRTVVPSFSLQRDDWHEDSFQNLNPWELWSLGADGLGIKLSVSYTHWDGGSNGWSTYRKCEDGTLKPLADY